ncbi:MAG: response regulator [Verrucomicrobiota bacterium]
MKLRALVFEDDEYTRFLLVTLLKRRGYEVIPFEDPSQCPLEEGRVCYAACADVLISDLRMPRMTGLEFLERQKKRGCPIANTALVSGAWSYAELTRAEELGCQVFHKPFNLSEVNAWLAACEQAVDPGRVLADLPTSPASETPGQAAGTGP